MWFRIRQPVDLRPSAAPWLFINSYVDFVGEIYGCVSDDEVSIPGTGGSRFIRAKPWHCDFFPALRPYGRR